MSCKYLDCDGLCTQENEDPYAMFTFPDGADENGQCLCANLESPEESCPDYDDEEDCYE